jgi:hypothetical protein
MLNYYMHDGPAAFRFELAGDLGAGDAAKLDQDWRTASSTIGDRTLIVDLSFVTAIDQAGLNLFRRWHAAGAHFVAISSQSREMVKTITGLPFSAQQPEEPTYQPWLSRGLSNRKPRGSSSVVSNALSRGSSRGLRSFPIALSAIPLLALITLLTPSTVWANDDGASMAFARYVSNVLESRDATHAIDTSDVLVEIDASLPKLAKQGRLEAVRHLDASGEPGYEIVSLTGDATIKHEVIARYLAIEQQAHTQPSSSFAMTPDNYRFRYTGSIESGGNRAYVFTIKPRRHGEGLIEGQIWIDQDTGAVVHQGGRLMSRKSIFIRKITVARDTGLRADSPYLRVTHVEIETRLFGPADLIIRERPQPAISIAGGQR